jgi:hypothetical protein
VPVLLKMIDKFIKILINPNKTPTHLLRRFILNFMQKNKHATIAGKTLKKKVGRDLTLSNMKAHKKPEVKTVSVQRGGAHL